MKAIRTDRPGARIDTDAGVPHRRGKIVPETEQLSFDDLGLPLHDATFLVVDVETTGEKPGLHSLTEIGAVKVRGGTVIGEFGSLVNPGVPIPAFITRLTGITTGMVATAPSLGEVLVSFIEFVGGDPDLIFVAHNAPFDMGQLRGAASALGLAFPNRKVIDTVKLSRRVFMKDEVPNHKLSTLARFVNATISPSHRALDDARATVDVLHAILGRLGSLGVTHVDDLMVAHSRVPGKRRMKARLADDLPAGPGVYQFIGPNDEVLYIGTSSNVYKRVRSYFTAAEKRKRIGEMVDLATRVDAIPTHTVLEAQILEIRLIRDIQPPYNRRSKPRSRYWVTLTDEHHPRLSITNVATFGELGNILGPFNRKRHALGAGELIAGYSGIRTCTQILPAVPARISGCHLAEFGACSAPCVTGRVQEDSLTKVRTVLHGDLDDLYEATLEKMQHLASAERFESATDQRERLYGTVGGAVAQAKYVPLIHAGRIIAAAPAERPDSWEVIVVDYGVFNTSAIITSVAGIHAFADHYDAEHPLPPAPDRPFDHTSTDELGCLNAWLWRDGTRIVRVSNPEALSVPVNHAQKINLPIIPGLDPAMWEV
ncbi:DEDD exnuclease domain-containing protein [Arcanobacterium haemolyticum]|uniref:DNA polymerase III, epsilon subunit n=1 Tax=Arcanobacterium haemolyticum (strain ATCC 9345 / DSM 20595 / CCM 5947 / CCUG 17215 / LMG 16163 / NBRC 15585 / NCTC 8452 / 11018) TaxID=644284 RepID=D7BNI3_ARCHD|nr:DEDD exonuclease domain-containing protein [Arcanobacterium haemolyticum]ADH92482.1 DNA polymerase III, epsilon subunit [Arcanobacterium haemolyticum DSM 20595]QCX46609.1 DEDD exnuclease domain-containing protein [Arcanobacterium haemolyticum]SQH28788.1 DNA polymerase III polC-type [Arcanobacterium haemolyticum]